MTSLLAAAGDNFNFDLKDANTWILIAVAFFLFLGIVILLIFFSFLRLWIQSLLAGARVGILDMIRMKLLNIDYGMIVRQKIALVQAGVAIETQEMEAHFLSKGDVVKVARAVIAAHKAAMDLPWRVAAAIDLAGRDVLDAVKVSVN